MDDLGVEVSDPRVRVKRFVLDEADRKVTLLTVYNQHAVEDVRVSVNTGKLGPVHEAAAAVLGGEVRSIAPGVSAETVTIGAPSEVLSAVLLVHRGTGVVEEVRRAE